MSESEQWRYRLMPHAGEEGYYEASTDVHLYDLLGYALGNLDSALPVELSDTLVATGAWVVPPLHRMEMEAWLSCVKEQPNAWFTPWRVGEPAIPADLWIDPHSAPPAARSSFLVARIDNPYDLGRSVRASLDRATGRFSDLRRAVEAAFAASLTFQVERATLAWLETMHSEEPEEDLGLGRDAELLQPGVRGNGAAKDGRY